MDSVCKVVPKALVIALGTGLLLPCLLDGALTMRQVVAGTRGVVAAGHPLVAEAGLRTLEKGGASEEFIRARMSHRNGDHQDTTCVNVIDRAGNMFSATPSGPWIPAVVAGDTGIPISTRAQSFVLTPGHPNQLAPLKHPRITLTPTIALRNGQPWLAFSTPGGDTQDQALLQVFLNIAEFGMNPQEAVEMPRFNSVAMYSSFDDHSDQPLTLDVEARFGTTILNVLRARGHRIVVGDDWSDPTGATIVEYDRTIGVIKAGADVREYRYALAW